ncbi:hypothetical protein GPA27_13585 [Aromatoleum toluolicum]|uniref:Uncharacterized protein n=1 Tax=Aromatoleum toluolicum TaxID=90060 RepID=A0ABX1NGI5_9RHOO|nr:hypothetical protein [Aromatoleum toluolicum]NMF98418.1 hypothetical protein [Aromatoleum toluolicum]
MNLTTCSAIAAFVLLSSGNSLAAEFQIKGHRLGEDESSACQDGKVVRLQELLTTIGVGGFDFPATSCDVRFDSVAGLKPSEPAKLLFWNGALIRIVIRFDGLDWSDAAGFRTAFTDLYGKRPSLKRSPPFMTESWRNGGQSLQLEWTTRLKSVGVYLTDDRAWEEYERARRRADGAVEAAEKKRRSRDVLN